MPSKIGTVTKYLYAVTLPVNDYNYVAIKLRAIIVKTKVVLYEI